MRKHEIRVLCQTVTSWNINVVGLKLGKTDCLLGQTLLQRQWLAELLNNVVSEQQSRSRGCDTASMRAQRWKRQQEARP